MKWFPSSKQFKKWSLPNKTSFVAAWLTIITTTIFCINWLFQRLADETSTYNNVAVRFQEREQSDLATEMEAAVDNLIESSVRLRESEQDLHSKSMGIIEELIVDIEQFRTHEGSTPETNFGIFLKSYYGLDSYPALGDALIQDLKGKQVEWSVRVVDVVPFPGTADRFLVIFEAIEDYCQEKMCPEGYMDRSTAEFLSRGGFIKDARQGMYVHFRGTVAVFGEHEGVSMRKRMHLHPEATYYYPSDPD